MDDENKKEDAVNEAGAPESNTANKLAEDIYGKARKASDAALDAIKIIIEDPMAGQAKAMEMIGEVKALHAGIVFAVVFSLSVLLFVYSMAISPISRAMGGIPLMGYIKLLLCSLIPMASLFCVFFGMAKLQKSELAPSKLLFTAGICCLPMAAAFLVSWLLFQLFGGSDVPMMLFFMKNGEIYLGLGFLASCISVIMINYALLDVLKMTARKALFFAPIVIVASGYVSYVIGSLFGMK